MQRFNSQDVSGGEMTHAHFVRIEVDQLNAAAEREQGIAAFDISMNESVEVHVDNSGHELRENDATLFHAETLSPVHD